MEKKTQDLTTVEGIVALMQESKSVKEWNANCDLVKKANGGYYPDFWYATIVIGGVMHETQDSWQ